MDIKNLIFEGGGVKGIAYVGSIEVLEEQGLLAKVESVSGTSAGAITSTLVALNCDAATIKDLVINLNFKKFEDGFNPFRLFTSYGLYGGDFFLTWIKDQIESQGINPEINFQEFAEKSFTRELKVFATDLNTRDIQEFSALKTPKTKVAEAVRASMSIPLFFKAWSFTNGYPNQHLYVDGGVLYNYPITIYQNLDETLGFYLTNLNSKGVKDDLGYWSPFRYIKNLFDTLLRSQNVAFEYNKLDQFHSVLINDLNVSATDFGLSNEMKSKLVQQGRFATEKYLGISDILS